MIKSRYHVYFAVLCMGLLVTFVASPSFAQRYPDRPIQFVIANVAGASMDITGRMLASELEKSLGQKVIPTNKPGASAIIGTNTVVKSKKDGYTLLYTSVSGLTFGPITSPEIVHYDPAKDLEFLGLHYLFPSGINVKADAPWKSFAELIDYAKKNPLKVRVSTTGVGSVPHFMLEMIQVMTGAQFTHVPFEGGESVVTAVLGGHVEASCDAYAKVSPHVDAGKIRVLLTNRKVLGHPQIPTITELGYKQSLPNSWFGLLAPAGIPDEAKRVLVPAAEKAIKNTKAKIEEMWGICEYKSPREFKAMWDEEYKRIYETAIKIGLRKP